MKSRVRALSLIFAVSLFAVCISCAAFMLAFAEESNYFVCFSNQNYAVRNANRMEYEDGEYILKDVVLSPAIDFYVTDNAGVKWYASDNSNMKVEESGVLHYDILFNKDELYENGSHIFYRFHEPDTYYIDIDGESVKLNYNPYNSAYDLYYISSVKLSKNSAVAFNDEQHIIAEDGYYRILLTPGRTVNGNKYLFDENGNYGSGDDFIYSVYIEDAPQYFVVFNNVIADETAQTQIDGKPAYNLTRYENNVAIAEYRSIEIFAPERDFGIKYCVYEQMADNSYRLLDDDNNEDTDISKITVNDRGWYVLSLIDGGESYLSYFVEQEKKFNAWFIAGEFNGYCFDDYGNIDLSEQYMFSEIEEGDDDYEEDYTQYIAYLTVTEKDLQSGDMEFYLTDGKTKYKDGTDYIKLNIAGKYKIILSEEHNYGRGRNYRYVLEDEKKNGEELLIGNANEFLEFAKNCTKSADYSINLKVYLTADIDFKGVEFIPVGTFSGTFYGGYHKLKNITYSDNGNSACVFESLTYSAVVERLTVENIDLGGKDTQIAGVAGTNYGKIYDLSVSGKITGRDYVGGICAINGVSDTQTGNSTDSVNKSSIEKCSNAAEISGETYVGGICGRNTGDIISCLSSGKIYGNKTRSSSSVFGVGGIAGYSFGKIYDCKNTGAVTGGETSQYVGGIAGLCVGEIYFSENSGNIFADKYAGGIAGYYGMRQTQSSSTGGVFGTDNSERDSVNSHNILNYNVNYGDVSAYSYVGGVVGNISALTSSSVTNRILKIYNCISLGNLSATAGSYVGGIVGYGTGAQIKSCLSSGTIQSKGLGGGTYVGGIVGYGGDIEYCMSSSTLKGDDYIGGIAGYASSEVLGCYTNVVILPSDGARNIGGIAGVSENYSPSKNEFTLLAGNYYIGNTGGIGGRDYGSSFDDAAACISSEVLSSSGSLSPVLCEQFSREYWQGGKENECYPVLRNFEKAEECKEFDDDKLFLTLFEKYSKTLYDISEDAAQLTYTVTFMEWNKDNGDLYDEGELLCDNFDIVISVRVFKGQTVEIPQLIYAKLNGNGKYVYEGDEASYFVRFPDVSSVESNLIVYAEYSEIVTSVTDEQNLVFIEGEFEKGTKVQLIKAGSYYTVKITLDDEEVSANGVILKYFVGENAQKFIAKDGEGNTLESEVSGNYISFEYNGGYFTVEKQSPAALAFWVWILIGIGGTIVVAGIALLTVYLIKKKRSKI